MHSFYEISYTMELVSEVFGQHVMSASPAVSLHCEKSTLTGAK